MSSLPPSDARSPAEPGGEPDAGLNLASVIHLRGIALLEALERHAPELIEHADATGSYAFAAAAELGLDRPRAQAVREAARLHDIGKVYVPAQILAKPAAELSAAEREQLEAQHEAAYRLALGAAIPEPVCDWLRHLGERSGAGARAAPLESRIIRAACACHTLLVASPPRAAGGGAARREAAIAGLRAASGGELDPDVVRALAAVLSRAG